MVHPSGFFVNFPSIMTPLSGTNQDKGTIACFDRKSGICGISNHVSKTDFQEIFFNYLMFMYVRTPDFSGMEIRNRGMNPCTTHSTVRWIRNGFGKSRSDDGICKK
jgi:hypothetical protein